MKINLKYISIILLSLFVYRVYVHVEKRHFQFYGKFLDSHVRIVAREILDIYNNCNIIIDDIHKAVNNTDCGTGLIHGDLVTDMYNKPLFFQKIDNTKYLLGFAANTLIQKTVENFKHFPLALIIDFKEKKILVTNGRVDIKQ